MSFDALLAYLVAESPRLCVCKLDMFKIEPVIFSSKPAFPIVCPISVGESCTLSVAQKPCLGVL